MTGEEHSSRIGTVSPAQGLGTGVDEFTPNFVLWLLAILLNYCLLTEFVKLT